MYRIGKKSSDQVGVAAIPQVAGGMDVVGDALPVEDRLDLREEEIQGFCGSAADVHGCRGAA
jgi:hypothetical protein